MGERLRQSQPEPLLNGSWKRGSPSGKRPLLTDVNIAQEPWAIDFVWQVPDNAEFANAKNNAYENLQREESIAIRNSTEKDLFERWPSLKEKADEQNKRPKTPISPVSDHLDRPGYAAASPVASSTISVDPTAEPKRIKADFSTFISDTESELDGATRLARIAKTCKYYSYVKQLFSQQAEAPTENFGASNAGLDAGSTESEFESDPSTSDSEASKPVRRRKDTHPRILTKTRSIKNRDFHVDLLPWKTRQRAPKCGRVIGRRAPARIIVESGDTDSDSTEDPSRPKDVTPKCLESRYVPSTDFDNIQASRFPRLNVDAPEAGQSHRRGLESSIQCMTSCRMVRDRTARQKPLNNLNVVGRQSYQDSKQLKPNGIMATSTGDWGSGMGELWSLQNVYREFAGRQVVREPSAVAHGICESNNIVNPAFTEPELDVALGPFLAINKWPTAHDIRACPEVSPCRSRSIRALFVSDEPDNDSDAALSSYIRASAPSPSTDSSDDEVLDVASRALGDNDQETHPQLVRKRKFVLDEEALVLLRRFTRWK
ncbi:hypothetical protein MMC09_006638 [Bachmanniomyces sp. S44760]|nr:hypothetical protein [Bachmanniomyces sp. S44760]